MLRVLQQFLLTTLLVLFASQANALFIQSDWLNPTEPGVGTNRYSYSFNDPVNLSDPGGNQVIDIPGTPVDNIVVGIPALVGGIVLFTQPGRILSLPPADQPPPIADETKVITTPQDHEFGRKLQSTEDLSRPNIDPEDAKHILDRHRPGSKKPGATEFPEGWSDQDILDGVSGVGISGEEVDGMPHRPDDIGLIGSHKGIDIEVIADGETGKIRTGYPSAGQEDKGTKENPERRQD